MNRTTGLERHQEAFSHTGRICTFEPVPGCYRSARRRKLLRISIRGRFIRRWRGCLSLLRKIRGDYGEGKHTEAWKWRG
jgi:hypothetical protein